MKRGFTLVELLGALVILSVLILIAFTTVTGIIKNSKNTVYYKQINSILSAAHDYTLKFPSELPKLKGEKKYISLIKLQKSGFVDKLINPKTKESFPVDLVVSIEYTGGNYKYDSKNSKLYGNYFYTVLTDDNKSRNLLLKPNMTIEGLSLVGNNTYYYNFNVGNNYQSHTPTVGENVEVINIILDDLYEKDGNEVYKIDITKKGNYYKYFIAIDPNGNSNYIIEHIVVTDNENPTLTVVPDTVEIGYPIDDYDLMTGVSCTDNSGGYEPLKNCTITTNVELIRTNTYSVTYTAKDPSGNSATKSRTISITN